MKADRTHNGYDCNDCGNSKCSGDVIRTKKRIIPIACPGQVKLGPMRVSLLEAASVHPGSMNAVGVILNNLDMRIEKSDRYPGFRLMSKKNR
jgi:hypothetical protein